MDYIFARFVLIIVAVGCYAVIAAGVLLAVSGAGIGAGALMQSSYAGVVPAAVLAAIPGTIIAFMGIFMMAVVDHFSATLDAATYAKKMLRVAEEQLRVSKQTLKLGELAQAGYGAVNAAGQGGDGASGSRSFLNFFGKKPADRRPSGASPKLARTPAEAPATLRNGADAQGALDQAPDVPADLEPPARREPQLTKPMTPVSLDVDAEAVPRVPPEQSS